MESIKRAYWLWLVLGIVVFNVIMVGLKSAQTNDYTPLIIGVLVGFALCLFGYLFRRQIAAVRTSLASFWDGMTSKVGAWLGYALLFAILYGLPFGFVMLTASFFGNFESSSGKEKMDNFWIDAIATPAWLYGFLTAVVLAAATDAWRSYRSFCAKEEAEEARRRLYDA